MALARLALLIMGSALLLVWNLGFWIQSSVLDSSAFAHSIGEVMKNSEARDRLGDTLAQQAFQSAEPTLSSRPGLSLLASLREEELRAVLSRLIAALLDTEAARDIVVGGTERLHNRVVDLLEGRTDRVTIEDDRLVLDFSGLIERVYERLDIDRTPASGAGQIVLVEDASNLSLASDVVRGSEVAVPAILVLSLLTFASVVLVSPDRFKGISSVGVAIVVAGVVSLLLRRLVYAGAEAGLAEHPVARIMLQELTGRWALQSAVIVGIGAVVAVAANTRVRDGAAVWFERGRLWAAELGWQNLLLFGGLILALILILL